MRMRAEREALIPRRINLRPVMVQEEKGIDLIDLGIGQRSLCAQIAYII